MQRFIFSVCKKTIKYVPIDELKMLYFLLTYLFKIIQVTIFTYSMLFYLRTVAQLCDFRTQLNFNASHRNLFQH